LITFMILFLAAVRDLDLVTAQTIMRNAKGAKSLMALASAERLSNLPVALADEIHEYSPDLSKDPAHDSI